MSALPPREFVRAVRDYGREHELLRDGERVVVGVSGGPDSVALLAALVDLAGPRRYLLSVAHLDHGLRSGSARDAERVVMLAASMRLTYDGTRTDVGALARRRRWSIEEAGRMARYSFFHRVAIRRRATAVAVGHHADDQAETILLRLLRGSSGSGLAGIAPARRLVDPLAPRESASRPVRLIRPLLGRTRAEIEAFVRVRRLPVRRDPSNRSTEFLRNRIRHRLIPQLEREYNPGLRGLLARAAQALAEDDAVLDAAAAGALRRGLRRSAGGASMASAALARLPLAVRRRVLWLAAGEGGADPHRMTQPHLDAMVRLLQAKAGEAHLPGAVARQSGGRIAWRKAR